jgi:hypothetical protein
MKARIPSCQEIVTLAIARTVTSELVSLDCFSIDSTDWLSFTFALSPALASNLSRIKVPRKFEKEPYDIQRRKDRAFTHRKIEGS